MVTGEDVKVKKGSLIQLTADGALLYQFKLSEDQEGKVSIVVRTESDEKNADELEVPRI